MDSFGDTELARLWSIDGDKRAAAALFQRHAAAVHAYLRRRAPDDADDLTQDTFLVFLANAQGFRAEAHVRTFLIGIAHHRLRMARRTRNRSTTLAQELATQQGKGPPALLSEVGLLSLLERLPEDAQRLVYLSYVAEFTERELAKILRLPVGTVSSRIRRARAKMRTLLRDRPPSD